MGIEHFWTTADAMSRGVAITLLMMSIASWSILLVRASNLMVIRRTSKQQLPLLWQSSSPEDALRLLLKGDRSHLFADITTTAVDARLRHSQAVTQDDTLPLNDLVTSALQHALLEAQARLESGLVVLASVSSTAPFVGLLGTVWGIYHALTGLAGESQVILGQVAGPVGEALIMTAAGLFTAIPAVLGYNAIVRANRRITAHLDGFAHALHAWIIAGIKAGPSTSPGEQ